MACAVTALPVATINQMTKKIRMIEKDIWGRSVMIATIIKETNTAHEKTVNLPILSDILPNTNAERKEAMPPNK